MKTPEHVYVPSCARCRDEAGKDRAKVPDDDLCAWHTTDALTTLRAENERLRTATEIEREGQRSMARALSEINRLSRLDVAVHLVPSAENERLRAAATEALAVLTRLADSAAYWSEYDVPVGLIAEIDEAKARLAGALSREARP